MLGTQDPAVVMLFLPVLPGKQMRSRDARFFAAGRTRARPGRRAGGLLERTLDYLMTR